MCSVCVNCSVCYVCCRCGIRYVDDCVNGVKKQGLISYVESLHVGTEKVLIIITHNT